MSSSFFRYEQFPHSGLMQASWQWARRSPRRRPLSPQDKQRGDSHGVSPRPSAVFTNRAELRRPSRARSAGERNLEPVCKVHFRVPWAPSAVFTNCAELRQPSRARLAGERNLELIGRARSRVPWAPPHPSAVFGALRRGSAIAQLRQPSRARSAGERNLEAIRKVYFRVLWAPPRPSAVFTNWAELRRPSRARIACEA